MTALFCSMCISGDKIGCPGCRRRVQRTHEAASIKIKRALPGVEVPKRAHPNDAGLDLRAAYGGRVLPNARTMVRTGIVVGLPAGTVGLVCPRSGLAAKKGVTVLNAPGIIDENYTGEVQVILHNASEELFEFAAGDRIAQLVVIKVEKPTILEVETLEETDRGSDGLGSTGA